MIRQRLTPAWFALAIAPLLSLGGMVVAQASNVPTQSCSYDPASGRNNPLGDRAAITINEINGDTIFTYQEIPTRSDRGPAVVVVAPKREITLENTSLEAAKQVLLENPEYYNDLIGYPSANGFATVNNSLTCWSNDIAGEAPPEQAALPVRQVPATSAPIAPRDVPDNPAVAPAVEDINNPRLLEEAAPASAATAPGTQAPVTPAPVTPAPVTQAPATTTAPATPAPATPVAAASPRQNPINIAQLPDGNYRLWNGQAQGATVSDDQLLEAGGALFIFNKTGDRITGNFAYIDSDSSYCVFGQGNNSTVSGFAYPYTDEAMDLGETFRNLGPTEILRVRRTRVVNNQPFYSSALLDLSSFQPINLGPVLPPTSCQS